MEKRRISLITLFLIIIVVAFIGIGVGYLITKNINNGQIVKEISSEDTKVQTEKNIESKNENSENVNIAKNNVETTATTNTVVEKTKYNGSKNIVVNGKTHTVSYKNESYFEEYEKFNTTIYLNDKKLKTFECHYSFDDDNLELITITGDDKEYIVISVTLYGPSDEDVYLLIANQEKELLDTVHVHACNIGISIDNIYSHKIYDNNIVFFKMLPESPKTKNGEKYSVAVYKVIVENNNVIYKLERLCTDDEVIFSGK